MTVLIALEHPETGVKAIAADGRCSAGSRIVSDSQRKIVAVGSEAWLGVSGQHVAVGLLREKLRDWTYPGGEALGMQLRAVLRDSGLWKWEEEDGGVSSVDFNGVAIGPDGVWYIGPDFSAVWTEPGWPAIGGSGGREAAGAALATIRAASGRWAPASVCREAAAVACALDAGCGGEVYTETLVTARKRAVA